MIRMAAVRTQRLRSLQAFWTKRVANFLVGRLNTAPSILHGILFIARENSSFFSWSLLPGCWLDRAKDAG